MIICNLNASYSEYGAYKTKVLWNKLGDVVGEYPMRNGVRKDQPSQETRGDERCSHIVHLY